MKSLASLCTAKAIATFIIIHFLAPATAIFTPASVNASNDSRLLMPSATNPMIQPQVHTPNPDDIINPPTGDEIDVPTSPLWDSHKNKSGPLYKEELEQRHAQTIANLASVSGKTLGSNLQSGTLVPLTKGMATNAAGSEIQSWLNQFGTSRVKLDTDKNLSLKNSQVDLLVSLYEQASGILFSQGSIHRSDDRSQANLGIGYRRFEDGFMLGGNTFFDYDLSRNHARMGVGLEYWKDYLKFGINSYHRLSNWKHSPDTINYEERPANGWDIRAQAWFPKLPQLGGTLTYEQYYGDEVSLFGKGQRQNNPFVIKAGINYTPVPLLTFNVEQRQGKSGDNDTRIGVDFRYQLGAPWHWQVNPNEVNTLRSLPGSRYDLVERNNNIVLEYRKKETIFLKVVESVSGYAGEQKPLGVSVTSHYGLVGIDWVAPSLISAGGSIVKNGADYVVELPAWIAGDETNNTYLVYGVAVDKKGNISNQTETKVTVQAPDVSMEQSTFNPVETELPADGKSTQTLVLSIRDSLNQAIDVPESEIAITTQKTKSAVISDLIKKNAGVYEINVTAGTDVETISITPNVKGKKLSTATVNIIKTSPSQTTSAIKTDKQSYFVGDNIAVTVTLKDAVNNPVAGLAAALSDKTVQVPNARLQTGGNWRDNGDGTYSAFYTAMTTGINFTAKVMLTGWDSNIESATYSINEDIKIIRLFSNGFVSHAVDAGFPSIGFKGAKFRIFLSVSGKAPDFNWTSDAPSWVAVNNDGEVTFTGTGTKDKVTITAKPKDGNGSPITYSFALKSWITDGGSGNWFVANSSCNKIGSGLPTIEQLNGKPSLLSEWGNIFQYSGAISRGTVWTSEEFDRDNHYIVSLSADGSVGHYENLFGTGYICIKSL
ncbi:inverse autotransporter beta domain-containing protein [Cedecea neteri]|uniref:inverse autotransporter beta domain-containing protein n=1 Tax=Cedecea neteri TaxID=158822 RepID=UPI002897B919|nr:inverse autotransporter beta domain-containing protein [Cedecea neteri]